MAFNFTIDIVHKGKVIDSKEATVKSRKNLFAVIKKEFPKMKFVLDKIYGAEVTEISGLKKSKKAGVEFRIDDRIPWTTDPGTEKKLYLSLYHITATEKMLAGRRIVLELVSVSCDFANSVVDARLDFRTPDFDLEVLPAVHQEIQMKFHKPLIVELDRYFWMLNMRRQSLLFGGFPGRKLIRDTELSYIQPSVQFNPNAEEGAPFSTSRTVATVQDAAPAQQGVWQPFFPSQEMSTSPRVQATEPEMMPFHLPEPSSPRPNRKPPGRFLLDAQVQSDAIMMEERQPREDETHANPRSGASSLLSLAHADSQPLSQMPQNEPIILAEGNTHRKEGQQGPIAASEAPVMLQMQQSAIQTEQYAAQKIKFPSSHKEKMPRATLKQEKVERQLGETRRSSSRQTIRPEFVPISSVKHLKAVIFDLDGVVINSMGLHRKSFNALLAPLGISISAKAFRKYGGTPSEKIIVELFQKHGIKESVKEWTRKRTELYQEYLEKYGVRPIEGFKEFYNLLLSNRIKVAVASSGEEPHIRAALESIGVRGIPVISIQQVKRGKPAPDLFLLAAKRLKVKKGQVIVFEDAASGLEAARRARMPSIALSTTLPEAALQGKAALIVRNFSSPRLRKLFSCLIGRR